MINRRRFPLADTSRGALFASFVCSSQNPRGGRDHLHFHIQRGVSYDCRNCSQHICSCQSFSDGKSSTTQFADRATAMGYSATTCESAEQGFQLIDSQAVDVVLMDLEPSDAGWLDVLHDIKHRRSDIEIIVVSGNATVDSAVQALKNGAYDFVTKPFGLQELKRLLERVGVHLQRKAENRRLSEKIKSNQGFGKMIGRAPEMDRLYRMIAKSACSAHPVLVLGESGTGKEMVARAIHYSGRFRDKPFVPVDCGSLVPTLIESELFGYVKGAFTGAMQSKPGLLAIAEGGTIFLDEVGELPLDLQAKLLSALQENSAGRQHETSSYQCAFSGRHQPRSRASGRPRSIPSRSVLPSERFEPASPSVARKASGHSTLGHELSGTPFAGVGENSRNERRHHERAPCLRLAGQCPRTGKLH